MKKIRYGVILLVFLKSLTYIFAHEVVCNKNLYCMACDTENQNSCKACYNWGAGKVGARVLGDYISDSGTTLVDCKTKLSDDLKQSGCKYYSGLITNSQTTQSENDCGLCSTSYFIWDDDAKQGKCSNVAYPTSAFNEKIDNCLNIVSYVVNQSVEVDACRVCKKNYSGSDLKTFNNINIGWETCSVKEESVLNKHCEYEIQENNETECYSCEKDYAVSKNGYLDVNGNRRWCIPFTTDENCRKLSDVNYHCLYCFHSYYWDNLMCTLTSLKLRFSQKILVVLVVLSTILNEFL